MAHGTVKLTCDIETFGGANQPTREDVKVPGNYKDPKTIANFIERELPGLYNKQALLSLKGEIACIGVALEEEPAEVLYRNGPEGELMQRFEQWLTDKGITHLTQVHWVGGNIDGFDLPYLLHRAWKYNLDLLQAIIPTKRYDDHIVDILRIFAGTDNQARHSVDGVAKFLGLAGKTGLPSADVPQAYTDGRHEEIEARCAEDVEVERAIAKKLQPWMWI